MNLLKSRKGNTNMWLVIALVALLVGGGMYFWSGGRTAQTGLGGGATVTSGQVQLVSDVNRCGDTKLSTLNVRIMDEYGNPKSAISSSSPIYLKDTTLGVVFGNTTGGTGYATIASVPCGTNKDFEFVAPFRNDTSGSAISNTFKVDETVEYVTLYTNRYSHLNARVEDLANGDDESMYPNNLLANATTFSLVNSTHVRDSAGKTNFTIGADGVLQLRIRLQAVTSNRFTTDEGRKTTSFVEPALSEDMGLRTAICLDYGTNDNWDSTKEQVAINRVPVNDVKSTGYFDANSLLNINISNSHKCYDLNVPLDAIGTVEVDVREQTKAGANPGATNDDITAYIVTEHIYRSSQDTNQFIKTFATDGTGKLLLNSQDARKSLTFDIE